jgi:3-oxoacyl-[acyl-carrier-protein] synthase-3
MIMNIRVASTAYAVPPDSVDVAQVLSDERSRVNAALDPLSENLRKRVLDNLGVNRVRVCGSKQPYDLALAAASQALADAAIRPADLDLIIDFVTLPGKDGQYLSFSQKISHDLGAETSFNLSYRVGGCAGLHIALKNAVALMKADTNLKTALLFTADSAPPGSRSLLPIAVQGDAGSALILIKDGLRGPTLLATEVLTLSHLYDTIDVCRGSNGLESLVINVDSTRIEREVMPIYYLNFLRLITKALEKSGSDLTDIDHFIYSNISNTDRNGFIQALRLPPEKVAPSRIRDLGHTFASDLVINYTDLCRDEKIKPSQLLLFASAGIGFTWGVTIARA